MADNLRKLTSWNGEKIPFSDHPAHHLLAEWVGKHESVDQLRHPEKTNTIERVGNACFVYYLDVANLLMSSLTTQKWLPNFAGGLVKNLLSVSLKNKSLACFVLCRNSLPRSFVILTNPAPLDMKSERLWNITTASVRLEA